MCRAGVPHLPRRECGKPAAPPVQSGCATLAAPRVWQTCSAAYWALVSDLYLYLKTKTCQKIKSMKKHLLLTTFLLFLLDYLHAQDNIGFGFYQPDRSIPCVTPEQHEHITKEINRSREELIQQGRLSPAQDREFTTLFEWPLGLHNGLDDYGYHGI